MPRKPRDIEKALTTKFGFTPASSRSSDHRCYELTLPGLPPIHTKLSHSKADIGPNLEGKIARQMRVRKPFFDSMMKCHKTRDEYYAQIRADPYPPFDVLL